ncbi:organic radical activating enzyme [Sphaerisporangium krabiense]|uniref:Organic radical activating enzyme n=1 Tax=Sphaerisporangium krabiense TaxID=763782 RepID=A0A7W8Z4E5_9ACTN|nr:organic radical activating enzyme [Sphaerisporangium krabiense]
MQLDAEAVDALHDEGFEVAIETNGTRPAPDGIDWICVSPKAGTKLLLTSGHDLKLVYPQAGAEPELFEHLDFDRFLLQPMDSEDLVVNTKAAIEYCLEHPQWQLSVQSHKTLGIR